MEMAPGRLLPIKQNVDTRFDTSPRDVRLSIDYTGDSLLNNLFLLLVIKDTLYTLYILLFLND